MSEFEGHMNLEPWEQGFCWFWYNDAELFRYTQKDFDARAKELSESGITIVLTFSLTHFRLSYYPYWQEINECLRKLVKACHRHGIRVVEHHSSNLTHNVLSENGWALLERNFFTYSHGTASFDNWKRIYPFLTYDYKINGVDFRGFSQIDGRNGEPVTNSFGTYAMCFNNPEYRKTYFEYLRGVVDTGIDGIMNDDVSYFGSEYNGCACEHCRRIFRETSGYELPTPEGWESFFENYENPAYVAWKRFKFDSTVRFYRDLTAFYESMGVKLLRPNYASDILKHRSSCAPFDRCLDLWDFIFQENCFSAIIKQSYLDFMVEAIHRQAAGEHYGVPSMSMFYPDRSDSTYFSWALARSWGQLYTGTCEGMDVTPLERPYRMFEKKHRRYYKAPKKIFDLSIYLSSNTRDFTANARYRYMQKALGVMQAAYEASLGLSMVMDDYSIEEMLEHRTLLLAYVAMASDAELSRFSEYVKRGGRLIILGDFATYDVDGTARLLESAEELLGVKLALDEAVKLGDGEILRLSYEVDDAEFQPTVWSNRRIPKPPAVPAIPNRRALRAAGGGRVLREIICPNFTLSCKVDGIVLTAYRVEGAVVLHLCNLSDTIAETDCMVEHTDRFLHFSREKDTAEKLPEITLTVHTALSFVPTRARLFTPERENVTELFPVREDGELRIRVPENVFSGYALIALEP